MSGIATTMAGANRRAIVMNAWRIVARVSVRVIRRVRNMEEMEAWEIIGFILWACSMLALLGGSAYLLYKVIKSRK